jgi:putative flippase GtrA
MKSITRPEVYSSAKEIFEFAPSSKGFVQLARSLVVSVIALVFDFSSLVFLTEITHLHYLIAATAGFIIGVIVNYYLSVVWVFAYRKLASKRTEFVIFVVICVIGLLLNLIIIAMIVEGIGADYRLAKVVSTVIVFFWNFIARKKILY